MSFPVFGLHANHQNALTLTTRFRDGSTNVAQVAVTTGAYGGPASIYAAPQVRTARGAASPGVEYMLIKNGVTAPVILDSDGQVRWASGPGLSFSSLFGDDAFYVGDGSASAPSAGCWATPASTGMSITPRCAPWPCV